MDAHVFGFDGYKTLPPPAGGFWRVSSWPNPFEPPPPIPLSHPLSKDDGGRFDDPAGKFRTLYCATDPEGALGECLGDFAYNASAARRVDAFLQSEPDDGYDEDYHYALTADDVDAFGWTLAHAPADPTARIIDVEHVRTYLAAAPRALPALASYGLHRFDRRTLLDERRYVTRTLAGIYRADATDPGTGALRAAGFRFTSRLPPAWECWALWDPFPLDLAAAELEAVGIGTPALRHAADLLGVSLA